jgi:F-type H+-transporting ATPase subunit gamma
MSDKLSDVQTRIESVQELETVVGAMRGIAAARSREARSRLDGIRACADIVGAAIGDALMLDERNGPSNAAEGGGGIDGGGGGGDGGLRLAIVICAEQGFVGTFNEHVIEEAGRRTQADLTEYFVLGDRGVAIAAEHGMQVGWSAPMVAHADEVSALASRVTEALYARLADARVRHVTVLHALPKLSATLEVVERILLPVDFKRFSAPRRRVAPLVTLPVHKLLAKLAEEYVYAQLCEAIMLSFSAENEARMRAMIAARTNVHNKLDQLIGDFRQLRQEEITSEIVELSAGNLAANDARHRRRPAK